jgi:alpha-D-ribose 1-methylphosphonate 5-triphosphate synthase subunit PhnG
MSENGASNLPAQIADAFSSVAKSLVPGMVKSLDRLVGAAIEVPVAKLEQMRAKIDAQTESYKLVESTIAQAVVAHASGDKETAQRALDVLVRKEYRKHANRQAVATAMVEDMREHASSHTHVDSIEPSAGPDDDWLNLFERYAEDASSERLQGLWGRVLAGEIRQPGRFSARTLRFLSEFSQSDALTLEAFARFAFGDAAPKSLVAPPDRNDIKDLVFLESSGLIQGVSGLGFQWTLTLDSNGYGVMAEGDLRIVLKGDPNSLISREVIIVTPLGQELLGLVSSRNQRDSARAVAMALRGSDIHEAYLSMRDKVSGRLHPMEVLWMKEDSASPVVEGTAE